MAFQATKMALKMAPETPRMTLPNPKRDLPRTDKPNLEGAAVIPEGIVNPPQGLALSRRGSTQVLLEK